MVPVNSAVWGVARQVAADADSFRSISTIRLRQVCFGVVLFNYAVYVCHRQVTVPVMFGVGLVYVFARQVTVWELARRLISTIRLRQVCFGMLLVNSVV